MEIKEIEQKIACGELSAAQVFTQMEQLLVGKPEKSTITVGTYERKEVTKLNNKLFIAAKDILDDRQHLSHIGWSGVGYFIDWLEENYDLTEITENKK